MNDVINAMFELFGGIVYILNIIQLYKDKVVQGISLVPTVFFTSWGLWNLYYYPSLGQWYSFYGAVTLVLANTTWLIMAMYYKNKGN